MTVPDLAALREAYAVTSATTQTTPLFESAALAGETGVSRIFVKPESLQWAGSFKIRGAFEKLKLVLEPSRAVGLAAMLDHSLPVDDETALIIATGGNVSLADFMGHVSGA